MRPRRVRIVPGETFAWVRWEDSAFHEGTGYTEDEIEDRVILTSAGYFVKQSAHALTLALDYQASDETWRYVLSIPLKNVLELKTFTIPKGKPCRRRKKSTTPRSR